MPAMLLRSESSCRPVSGGGSACIKAANCRRSARSRFITAMASRSRQSLGVVWKRSSRKQRNFFSSAYQCSRASGSSAFCGSSSTYIGRDWPISSYIFFLPSQVVSPTTRSAISRKGLLRRTW